MKNIIITLLLCLLLAPTSHADVDTLLSEPIPDGKIDKRADGSLVTNSSDGYCEVGDVYYAVVTPPDYETPVRGYLSFNLDSLPDTITVNIATLRVYQYYSYGNSIKGLYPQWTGIPGGDTLYCLLDHINYGPSIDTLDWTAGDIGDLQTLTSRFGIISSTPDTGWKSMDVTSCVQSDLMAGRIRNQYRLRFPILSDFDGYGDYLAFYTGSSFVHPYRAMLIIDYVVGVEGKPDTISKTNAKTLLENSYPMPFKAQTTISYNLGQRTLVCLAVYNLQGKLLRTLVNGCQDAGKHAVKWDGRDEAGRKAASGIYFYRLASNEFNSTKKMVVLK